VERLGHVVLGAEAEAGHHRFRVGQAGQHQHRLVRPLLHDLPERPEAVLPRHQQVQHHQVVPAGQGHRDRLLAVGGGVGLDALVAEDPHQHRAEPFLVIGDQHPGRPRAGPEAFRHAGSPCGSQLSLP
jgi:hypothetical protein